MINILKSFSILGLFFLLTGCGGSALNLEMAGMPNVNPDTNGRPSPVLIKMYELRSDLIFKQADMLPLFENPVETLGPDMVAYDDITIIPGEAKTIIYEPNAETRFVGVVASFRDINKYQWKIIKNINPEKKTKIALELNGANLILIDDEKAKRWEPAEAISKYQEKTQGIGTSSTYSNTQHEQVIRNSQQLTNPKTTIEVNQPRPIGSGDATGNSQIEIKALQNSQLNVSEPLIQNAQQLPNAPIVQSVENEVVKSSSPGRAIIKRTINR